MLKRPLIHVLALLLVAGTATTAHPAPGKRLSPPGQLVVVEVNARQHAVLGRDRFDRLFELVEALRSRPLAFNGGYRGAVAPPDVIVISEMRASNLEIFKHLLRQQFNVRYQIAGTTSASAMMLVNAATTQEIGEPVTWQDPCVPTKDPTRPTRVYQYVRLQEIATAQPFVVAGIHLLPRYSTDPDACREQNVEELKLHLIAETSPVFVAGDFNRSAVTQRYECDRNERSDHLPWWSSMTSSVVGPAFLDSVRNWSLGHGRPMAPQWTFERHGPTAACDGSTTYRRSRIDYIFARNAIVAEASADHPGWSGRAPGTKHPTNFKYSDHRFISGRYVLVGPPRPPRPSASLAKGGVVNIDWEASAEGVTEWVVYRAIGARDYDELAVLPPDATAFSDGFTEHGRKYRYSIAARGVESAQGLESKPQWAVPDARGPHVIGVKPHRGATGVDVRANITAYFDGRIAGDSVDADTIELYRGERRVRGRVTQTSRKAVTFNPSDPLKKGITYRVQVRTVKDSLGNRGERTSWRFTTVEPPPKKKKRR